MGMTFIYQGCVIDQPILGAVFVEKSSVFDNHVANPLP